MTWPPLTWPPGYRPPTIVVQRARKSKLLAKLPAMDPWGDAFLKLLIPGGGERGTEVPFTLPVERALEVGQLELGSPANRPARTVPASAPAPAPIPGKRESKAEREAAKYAKARTLVDGVEAHMKGHRCTQKEALEVFLGHKSAPARKMDFYRARSRIEGK